MEGNTNSLQTFVQYISGNTATRSVSLIIIYEKVIIVAWQLTPVSLMLAPTYSITQGAQQKVKACEEARPEICLCSA